MLADFDINYLDIRDVSHDILIWKCYSHIVRGIWIFLYIQVETLRHSGLIFNNIMAVMWLRLTSGARWLEEEMLFQRED